MTNFIRKMKFEIKTLAVGIMRQLVVLVYRVRCRNKKHVLKGKKIAIYTSLYGEYDNLSSIKKQSIDVDWICFTDTNIESEGWKYVLSEPNFVDNRKAAKWYKINASKIEELKKYDYTIYIDASTEVLSKYFAEVFLCFTKVLGFYRHPQRRSVLLEAEISTKMKKYRYDDLVAQAKFYVEKIGIDNNLWAGGVIVRKMSVPEFEDAWWNEMSKSLQDQISLPYAVYLSNAEITSLPTPQYSHIFLRFNVIHRLDEYETA